MAYEYKHKDQPLFDYEQQLDIIDVLQQRGYELVRKGQEFCLKDHPNVTVKSHSWYSHKLGRGGRDAASFLSVMEGYDYKAAVYEIVGMKQEEAEAFAQKTSLRQTTDVNEKHIEPMQRPKLFLPERSPRMSETFAYLIKTRCLDKDIVQELVGQKKIYQSREYFLSKSQMNDKPVKILSLEQIKDIKNSSDRIARVTCYKFNEGDFHFYKAYNNKGELSYIGIDDMKTDIDKLSSHGLPVMERHNCVFIGYDEQRTPQYANMRGTNSDKPFKQEIMGSKKEYAFRINENIDTDTVYVFEAPIDAISYASFIKLGGGEWQNYSYICLGGLSSKALDQYLQNHDNIKNITLCIDNDEAADTAADGYTDDKGYHPGLIEKYKERGYNISRITSAGKDWNEDLISVVQGASQSSGIEQTADDINEMEPEI